MVVYINSYWRRVWRYQRGNQNPYIEERQTTQWLKEKEQKDKQRSTKHATNIKDRVTRNPLKSRGELVCSGRVSSSCSTSGTRRVNLVTNPVISHEWGQDREVFTTSGTYPCSLIIKWKKQYITLSYQYNNPIEKSLKEFKSIPLTYKYICNWRFDGLGLGLWCLNAIFNNVSVISWRSVLLVKETWVHGENH
jgi:hypothetical protein